jgi:hypothetical protein
MPGYRVNFFKNLLSSDGHPFKCPQRTIDVASAASSEEAIRSAWVDYERAMNGNARFCADVAEAELIEPARRTTAEGRSARRAA